MINDRLITLVILSELKSYTKTAKKCNITQPAVTQHIKALEEEYGITIFNKKGKDLILTKEGTILVKNAKRLIALNNNINKELHQSLTSYQKLDIGVTLTASGYFIPEIMNVFKKEHPNLRYNFHTDIASNIFDRLKYLELDFAIVDGTPPKDDFISELIAKDDLIFIAPKNHPLANLDNVAFEMLKKEKIILRHEKANTRVAFENYLTNHLSTIDDFDVILEIDNTALIKQLIIEGHGISLMSRAICEQNLNVGVLKEIKLKDFKLERGIYLVYRKEMENDPIINLILDLKKEKL